MIGDNYIKESELKIKQYVVEKNFNKAFELYKNLAQKFPYDKNLKYIKSDLEKAYEIELNKQIKTKLEKTREMLKKKQYKKTIEILKPLTQIAPKNKKLQKTYSKAIKLYKKEIDEKQKTFRKTHEKNLNILLNGNVNEFLKEINSIDTKYPGNNFVKKFLNEYKNKYIINKLEKNNDLIYSNKFEVIERLIEKLKKIDKNNTRLSEIEKGTRLRKYQNQEFTHLESIYEVIKNLETLIKLKKYGPAFKAAKELMKVAGQNEEVKKYFQIAKKKLKKQNINISAKIVLESQNELIKDYKNNKSSYTKI